MSNGVFGIGMTVVEPGGARTEFRYGTAQVVELLPAYDNTPAHSFLRMLDPQERIGAWRSGAHGRGDHQQRRSAARTAAADARLPALQTTLRTLRQRIAGYQAQAELAASTDFPPGD